MGNKLFAERIHELRKAQKLTLEELGEKVGLGKTTVLNWEKNGAVPNQEVLLELSSIFETTIDYLLGNDENTDSSKKVLYRNWNALSEEDKVLVSNLIESLTNKRKG